MRRILGRAVTSPAAFFVAGLIDLGSFWVGWARERVTGAARRGGRTRRSGRAS